MTDPLPFKRCGCGRSFPREAWETLPLVGYQVGEGRFGDPVPIVLRNCPCGSTLSVHADRPTLARASEAALDAVPDRASRSALRAMLDLLEAELGVARRDAGILRRRLASARRET